MTIHPSAIVSSRAHLGANVDVGPYAIIEDHVTIGNGCRIRARAQLCSGTTLGTNCDIHMNAIVGHLPQDFSHKGEPVSTHLGNDVIVRENATIHGSIGESGTLIGDTCYLMVGSHVVHRGTHLDGERLAPTHPLHSRLPAQAMEAEPRGYSEAESALLRVRRHCAWGLPGRNPYRGSAVQALQTATLSPTVVKQIASDIRAGRRVDRVRIDNSTIRAERSGREFDPQRVAMTYGMTLCVDTRINLSAGHSEGADLYEAMDDDGRIYAVMVPDACGNVSVLGQRYVRETAPTPAAAGLDATAASSTRADPRPWMRLPPEERIRQLPDGLRYADREGVDDVRPGTDGQPVNWTAGQPSN